MATQAEIEEYWELSIPETNFVSTRDVTWSDIKECIQALNESGEDVFSGLHRYEGGFMCVSGPTFKSTERVDSMLPHQNPPPDGQKKPVHKEIRFSNGRAIDWPSHNNTFLGSNAVGDEHIVMKKDTTTSFRFQGDRCAPWTNDQCQNYANVVARALKFELSLSHSSLVG